MADDPIVLLDRLAAALRDIGLLAEDGEILPITLADVVGGELERIRMAVLSAMPPPDPRV
jgi:hypothetical protein